MKQEHFYESNKAQQRGFWYLATPMIILILVGGYFLTKDQPYEPDIHQDVKKEYQRMRKVYKHTGHIGQNFTTDTIYIKQLSTWSNINIVCPLLNKK